MNNNLFHKAGPSGFILCATLLITLTGCVGYVDGPRAGAVYVEPAPVFLVQEDYVYYPRYGMYYGSHSHQYYYQDGRSWVGRPSPRGVSVGVLFSSPSVKVDFHDSPVAHHTQVRQSYPKNWKPSGGDHGRKKGHSDNRREDKQDDHKR